jgi:hypothetical protein
MDKGEAQLFVSLCDELVDALGDIKRAEENHDVEALRMAYERGHVSWVEMQESAKRLGLTRKRT